MSITESLAAFSDALATLGIHPNDVDVSLSIPDWKALDRQLAKEHADGLFESIGATGGITLRGVRCFR